MRSSTLPLMDKKGGSNYKTKKDFYHISFASECQRCFETSVKPRRLPCEHEFCKSCLKDYFKEIADDVTSNTFPCPACDKPIQKPLMPKTKWTKVFKIDNSSKFYAGRPSSASSLDTRGSRSLDRFFSCKINTETHPCTFWGGDVSPFGEIFLPDWCNRCVKVFSEEGKLLTTTKFSDPPLDVTVLPGNVCVVSFGRVKKLATLLEYVDGKFKQSRNVVLDGNLYCTTRLGQRCLGILELNDGNVTLVTISGRQTVRLLDLGEVSGSLGSHSGVGYDRTAKRIYLTEKNNLICLDSAGKLIFEKSYPRDESDHYSLGSVACDHRGNVYLASDHCLLRTCTNGTLLGLVRTTLDPFHVMVSMDGQKLFVIGRNDKVEICSVERRASTEA